MKNVRQHLENFANILFPKVCVGCGAIGSYICPNCQKQLIQYERQRCLYCNRPSLYGLTHPACKKMLGIDGVISGYRYSPLLKRLIKVAKYRLAKDALYDLLLTALPVLVPLLSSSRSPYRSLTMAPIPLHWQRVNRRGFNQSEVVCGVVGRYVPTLRTVKLLKRVKATHDQATLTHHAKRTRNIAGVFRVASEVQAKRILLVDDVITTGSTIKEAAAVLKRAGATCVYGLSLARG